jgi:hypothetical protein
MKAWGAKPQETADPMWFALKAHQIDLPKDFL